MAYSRLKAAGLVIKMPSTTDGFYANSFQGQGDIVDDFQSFGLGGRLIFESDRSTWDFKARVGEVEAASITFNAAFALPDFATELAFRF